MIKNIRNKMIDGKETSAIIKKIRCNRDSDMPNIGLFLVGDVVEDAEKIAAIGDNPNFEVIEEETI